MFYFFSFSGKETVLGVAPQRFDETAREIFSQLKSAVSPILFPKRLSFLARIYRA